MQRSLLSDVGMECLVSPGVFLEVSGVPGVLVNFQYLVDKHNAL